jgi:hypothetical protein
MALIARSNARRRVSYRFGFCLLFSLSLAVTTAAQTATYRLHREASTTTNLFQLKPVNPDAAVLAIQSVNLKNLAAGEYVIKQFDTQSGVPNVASGSERRPVAERCFRARSYTSTVPQERCWALPQARLR